MATQVELKRQLQEKCLELEKEIALRKLLNSQKDEQAKKLRAAKQQLERLTATERSSLPVATERLPGPDSTDKEPLLNLLREAEERNKELIAKLQDSEAELQSVKLSQLRSETANSAKVAAQSAALMKRLSSMQREREKVLTSQLKVALKERQEALTRAGALVQGKDVTELAQKTEFQQIFDEMREAKDSYELQHQGVILVEKVKALRQKYDDSVRDKLQFLKSDRDAAVEKAQALMLDIAQLQRRLEMTETEYKLVDKTRIKGLQAQLEAAIKEKETWEHRSLKLEDTIETLKVLSSLQRSLRKDDEVKRQYELEIRKYEAEREALEHKIQELAAERNLAVMERNEITRERNTLAIHAQEEFDRAEKYQRIATILRKKARSASVLSDKP